MLSLLSRPASAHHGLLQGEPLLGALEHGQQGVPLEEVAGEHVEGDGQARRTHQQSELHLRMLVLAALGVARYAQLVLVVALEMQRGHVVEHDAGTAAHVRLHVRVGDLFDTLLGIAV